jgi:uncharacterized membrane protein
MSSAAALEQSPDSLSPRQVSGAYAPLPDGEHDGRTTAHAIQTIRAEPLTLYNLWRNLSLIPLWQEHVVSVTSMTGSQSHWVMGNPEDAEGKRVAFDSEIFEDVPGSRIAWRSISGDVDQTGRVTFEPVTRGTLVTLLETVKMPFGAIGNAVSAVAKRSPRQTVIENLRHFKQLAETGEIPSVKGQPHGPRGLSGGFKEWLYGESNPTPPGTSE